MLHKNEDEKNEKRRIRQLRHYHNNKSAYRNAVLKSRYGITIEQYDEIAAQQNNVCAICGKAETYKYNKNGILCRLAIDHNHKTGKIRGLLCQKCNAALGFLNEDVCRLSKMIEYLLKK